jgi:hypothetical protein
MLSNDLIQEMLGGGDRRSIGAVEHVVALVLAHSDRAGELVESLWDSDAVVRMRAADALEKVSRERAEWIEPFKANLLGLMAETGQQEVRWHLAAIVPRLKLAESERRRVLEILRTYLEDCSSIVKTFAMQGMWDLAEQDAALRPGVVDLFGELTRTGTAAMRARGRKLLLEAQRRESR